VSHFPGQQGGGAIVNHYTFRSVWGCLGSLSTGRGLPIIVSQRARCNHGHVFRGIRAGLCVPCISQIIGPVPLFWKNI
jgi:hypothetical protein